MAKAHSDWKVLSHEPVQQLAENLRWVSGALPGMSLKRTMTVARLADGRLVIHNAIALDEASMAALEAWGTPSFLIVPNGWHRLDAPAYKARYPQLRVYGPRGSRKKIEEVLPLDGTCEDFPAGESVTFEPLNGVAKSEAAMLVRSSDGVTLVLTDAMFNMDRKRDVFGFLFTTALGSAPGPRVSRLAKLAFIKDKKALRADLERFAELPGLVRVIVAHEKVASGGDAKAALLQAATYL